MQYHIERNLPSKIQINKVNRYLLEGWVFGDVRVRSISAKLFGQEFVADSFEILRPDVAAVYNDPQMFSLFSGFSIPIVIDPVEKAESVELVLKVVFNNGRTIEKIISTILLEPYEELIEEKINLPEGIFRENLLVICLATYNPERKQFERQINSIINQDFSNWICIINDDCSSSKYMNDMLEITKKDNRIFLFRNKENLGFYYNFEQCLKLVPKYAKYVALADQDDYWYPNKLSLSLQKIDEDHDIQLVYCDMKIVQDDGNILFESYWSNRKNYYNSKDLDLLAIANTVTGAASIFKYSLTKEILPFPPKYGNVFHDQWIAIVAAMKGKIEYINIPLYDYIQYGKNIIGHTDFTKKNVLNLFNEIDLTITQKQQLSAYSTYKKLKLTVKQYVINGLRAIMRGYEFQHINAKHIFTLASTALIRNPDTVYKKLLSRPFTLSGLLKVHLKVMKNKETLNNLELSLFFSKIINILVRKIVIPFRKKIKAFIKKKNLFSLSSEINNYDVVGIVDPSIIEYKRKFFGRTFELIENRPQTINLFISIVDPKNFFGGYIGMYNFAKKYFELGFRVRILVTDQKEINPDDLIKVRNHDLTLKDFLSVVEFLPCYSDEQIIQISEDDIFIATSWWTAYIANEAVKKTRYSKFIYLSQDYEPVFYEHGAYRVLADNSYFLNYTPFFSTELLQKYFLSIGYIKEENAGEFFNNPVLQFKDLELTAKKKRKNKLLFYARPQAQNARNLYPIGCLAIDRARELGGFSDEDWEIIAIGGDVGEQLLPSGVKIKHIGKFDMKHYADLLPDHDIGFSLMDSPHPSLLPIEMASAGMLVVTNTYYGIKDEKYFKQISHNIKAVEPNIETLANALLEQADKIHDFNFRIKGSKVNWPHHWEDSITKEKIQRTLKSVFESEITEKQKISV